MDARPVEELRSALANPPAATTAPCLDPVPLPDGAMGAGSALRYWSLDRAALAACKQRHADQTEFYRERDAALAGAERTAR